MLFTIKKNKLCAIRFSYSKKIVKSFKLDELAKLSRFISTLDSKDERFLYTATLLTESDFCDLINKAIDIVDMFDVLKGI